MGAMDQLLQKFVTDALKSLNITPEDIRDRVVEVSSLVIEYKVQMDRIEARQELILTLLQQRSSEATTLYSNGEYHDQDPRQIGKAFGGDTQSNAGGEGGRSDEDR